MDISSEAVKQLIGDLYIQNAVLAERVKALSDALSAHQESSPDDGA